MMVVLTGARQDLFDPLMRTGICPVVADRIISVAEWNVSTAEYLDRISNALILSCDIMSKLFSDIYSESKREAQVGFDGGQDHA